MENIALHWKAASSHPHLFFLLKSEKWKMWTISHCSEEQLPHIPIWREEVRRTHPWQPGKSLNKVVFKKTVQCWENCQGDQIKDVFYAFPNWGNFYSRMSQPAMNRRLVAHQHGPTSLEKHVFFRDDRPQPTPSLTISQLTQSHLWPQFAISAVLHQTCHSPHVEINRDH